LKISFLLNFIFVFSLLLPFVSKSETKSTQIRVLTYNVQGLPWPIKTDHGELQRIGEIFAERRKAGTQPQIVVLQEAFKTSKIKELIRLSGYKYVFKGPESHENSPFDPKPKVCGPRDQFCRTEEFSAAVNSGVYILSDFPITKTDKVPFGYKACAGSDCYSNKSVIYASISIPGYREPLHIFNTHMNSGKSSGASTEQHEAARFKQTEIMNWFINKALPTRDGKAILALGDFNQAPQRHTYLIEDKLKMSNAQQFCLNNRNHCNVVSSESADALYYSTPDHQLYQSGAKLSLTPIEINKTFYEKVGDRQVSDHLGLEVVYHLQEN